MVQLWSNYADVWKLSYKGAWLILNLPNPKTQFSLILQKLKPDCFPSMLIFHLTTQYCKLETPTPHSLPGLQATTSIGIEGPSHHHQQRWHCSPARIPQSRGAPRHDPMFASSPFGQHRHRRSHCRNLWRDSSSPIFPTTISMVQA